MKKGFEFIKKRIRWMYHRLRMSDFVWRNITNKKSINFFRSSGRSLDTTRERIVSELATDGISFARIEDFFSSERISLLNAYVESRVRDQRVVREIERGVSDNKSKSYNVNLLETNVFSEDSPLLAILLDPKIIGLVNAYMGMYSKFRGYRLWASLPVPKGSSEVASQAWHRDPEDKKIVKIFVYYSDVDENSGPFTYIKESHVSRGKWSHLYPQLFPAGSYPPRGALEKIIPQSSIVQAKGKKGTMVFCDTSGFHKGGYCTLYKRIMSIGAYASAASREPINFAYPKDFVLPADPSLHYALDNWELHKSYTPSGM